MKILLAEDDLRLGKILEHMLKEKEGYTVEWYTNGLEAYEYALASHYDLVILDWMLPKIDGISVCQKLRQNDYSGAILMLTAKDDVLDRIEGLDSGADDYLTKPFEFEELFARIRVLIRRNYAPLYKDTVTVGNIKIDRTKRTIYRNGIETPLTPREFDLLDLLIRNKGQVLTREVILDRVWGYHANVGSNSVDAYIKLLRKKIDEPGKQTMISNIRGVGYSIET
ncbi:response regulator transcription factor [Shimazuella sp. AN120528]|uniref:response regulator transcription factor n=1 Tax=Shimazuella soli TaxID=1892854 RepID=UPI001F0D5587|nr:response regulator transcription factor [Shimazuella soli]MCH5583946.1 response regulator transcription factor [Shimazuella soli]